MMRSAAFMNKALAPLRWAAGLVPLRGIGWPVPCGLALLLASALLLNVSHQLRSQKDNLHLELQQARISAPQPAAGHTRGLPVIFPSSSDYTADLAQIFDIAKTQGIVLASGDYHDADPTALGLDTRLVELRIDENYSKLKEFLANVLNAMPHAAVQELRIERKDGVAVKHQVFLKLALVYSPRSTTAQAPQVPGKKTPAGIPELDGAKAVP